MCVRNCSCCSMWSEYILRVSGHSFYHTSLRLKRKQSSLSQVPFSPLLALTAFEAPKMVPAVCLGLYTPHPNLHYALPCLGPTAGRAGRDSEQSSAVQHCQGQYPKSKVWTTASQGPAAPPPQSSLCHRVSQSAGWVGFNRISLGRFFPGSRGARRARLVSLGLALFFCPSIRP